MGGASCRTPSFLPAAHSHLTQLFSAVIGQTLDQLPLTNPEHFGTPVIGKKSNRGGRRSSQAV